MNKKLLILTLLLLTACGRDGDGPIVGENIHKGTNGLEMFFVENSLPQTIPPGAEFNFEIELLNEGATDIINGILKLNVEESVLESEFLEESINLEGVSSDLPFPSSEIKRFVVKTKELDPQTETITSNIILSACYEYFTDASFTVCIDTDQGELVTAKACEVQTITSTGQGAPVAVSIVEPRMPGIDRIQPEFNIKIENRGNGEVVRLDKTHEACTSAKLTREDLNIVHVRAFLSELELECNEDSVKLKQGSASVRCKFEEGYIIGEPAFSTILTVLLDYGYTSSIAQEVIVKRE